MKVYAVYSIPKSPEYQLEKLFKTKEAAKNYIKNNCNAPAIMCNSCFGSIEKISIDDHDDYILKHIHQCSCACHRWDTLGVRKIYDIQIEEVEE